MRQTIPYSQSGLLSRSTSAISGANKHAATVALVYHNAANLTLRRTAAVDASDARDVGVQDVRNARLALEQLATEARNFAILSRDVLQAGLGRKYTQAWAGTGFTNSLEVPTNTESLETLVESIGRFLTDYPAKESSSAGVTAAAATQIYTDLSAARIAVESKETDLRTLSLAKTAAFTTLRRALAGQARELKELLPATDSRWRDYGLNIPGLPERPEIPVNIIATFSDNEVSVKWDRSARAEYYRIWLRVAGSELPFDPVGSSAEPIFEIAPVQLNVTLEVALSALNDGGESQLSAPVTVQTS